MIITSGLARRMRASVMPNTTEVLAQRGEVGTFHPLELDPQQHDDVGIPDGVLDDTRGIHAEAADAGAASASAVRTPTRRRQAS